MRRARRPFAALLTTAVVGVLAAGVTLGSVDPAPAPVTGIPADSAALGLGEPAAPVVLGPAEPDALIDVGLALRGQDPDGLARFLVDQQDPASPDYRHFLTAAEFGDRFGLSLADEEELVARLTAAGFTITQRFSQRTSLRMRGTAADLSSLLDVRIELLEDPRSGARYHASAGTPVVPPDLQGAVLGVTGLERSLPLSAIDPADAPDLPARGLKPRDLAVAYEFASMWDQGIQGQGTSVAIVQLGPDTDADLAVFDAQFGIDGPLPERIAWGDGIDADVPEGFAMEATLDTQVVRAVAPQAQILVYETGLREGIAAAVSAIVEDGRAQFISLSYGKCFVPGDVYISEFEVELGQLSFQAAAAAGVTLFAASGDWGAYTCHLFDPTDHQVSTFWPSCTDNVVGVGGTYLETRADGSYLRETGWQDYLVTGGTGGGISPVDPRPAWQTGPGVDNPDSNGNRQCPDVSAVADPDTGYFIFVTDPATGEADWQMVGGTSAAAPMWAGVMALIQQQAAEAGIDRLGYLNPLFYQVAQTDPDAFHDVVRGGNLLAQSGGGWDYATGLGTPRVSTLADALIRAVEEP